MDNNVTISGNLTRDPELRYTPSGVAIANFGVAVNRRFQTNGQWEEATSFFDVATFKDLAENVSESLHKGDRVVVTGRLDQRSWEDTNGGRRTAVQIVAEDVGASVRFANVRNIQRITKSENSAPVGSYVPSEEPF